jgi:Fic family protein
MALREADDQVLFNRLQEQNLLRQYDLLNNCIEIGQAKGIDALDKYTLWSLNAAAVANIAQFGGRFREEPVIVGQYNPPHHEKVPHLVDQFLSLIHENWNLIEHPLILPAFALWRLNWIHPFIEGNGRTARATCYYLISLKQGRRLPGTRTVAERIRDNRQPYYDALQEADRYWAEGRFNVKALAKYLEQLLADQLAGR